MANIVILMELMSPGVERIAAEINRMGPSLRLANQAWTVNTQKTPGQVLRVLLPHISHCDKVFVVDASTDKSAWYNFGPEFDSRMRAQWKAGQSASKILRARDDTNRMAGGLADRQQPQPVRVSTSLSAMAMRDHDEQAEKTYLQRPLQSLLRQRRSPDGGVGEE